MKEMTLITLYHVSVKKDVNKAVYFKLRFVSSFHGHICHCVSVYGLVAPIKT